MKTFISFITILLTTSSLFGGTIKTKTYHPGSDAIFDVASTIVYGKKDAYLIDVQFQKQYAEELVNEIKALKRNLKLVYISHSDPDYYFATDIIKKNFPNAKIVSTAQTAYLINASKDGKLAVWSPQLKNDAPSEIIIPEAITTLPDLEGNKIEIKQTLEDPAHSFLWIPSIKTILGGISVSEGAHIWMADTQTKTALNQWIQQIDNMKALKPSVVIPSHFLNKDFSPKILDFVKDYLIKFKEENEKYETADKVITSLKEIYPNLPGIDNLELGAKVYKGEMNWDLKNPYPAIGRKITVDFGELKFDLDFKDHQHMSFIGTAGSLKNITDNVEYTAIEVANNIFMVYWIEPKIGARVVNIQDYNNNTIYTNIAGKDSSFNHLQGKLQIK
ncbi:Glyoxylase, beta-lactamase superfamily II [Chishuiella changwenlii]|uniref:Glyoxylase, beta-lactamase superfamily II n=1 Tax=Chishuiella changwenlii TaxID=1434701 RepID=A0A1M6TZ56_9FLAO|nr:MBL fold metallo-hydrolase [Chishuiella changwenlii]GGF08458.1 MBL fold metallo-hydrolase [Chishuiella changwenlii]SHK62170.1 Glyoxylase, beta-lactamase superfamily II [Chishuiella changwenlii]